MPAVSALIRAGLIVSSTCRPIAPRKPVRPFEKSFAPPSSPPSWPSTSYAAPRREPLGISAFSIAMSLRSACSSFDGTNIAAAAKPATVAPATIAHGCSFVQSVGSSPSFRLLENSPNTCEIALAASSAWRWRNSASLAGPPGFDSLCCFCPFVDVVSVLDALLLLSGFILLDRPFPGRGGELLHEQDRADPDGAEDDGTDGDLADPRAIGRHQRVVAEDVADRAGDAGEEQHDRRDDRSPAGHETDDPEHGEEREVPERRLDAVGLGREVIKRVFLQLADLAAEVLERVGGRSLVGGGVVFPVVPQASARAGARRVRLLSVRVHGGPQFIFDLRFAIFA